MIRLLCAASASLAATALAAACTTAPNPQAAAFAAGGACATRSAANDAACNKAAFPCKPSWVKGVNHMAYSCKQDEFYVRGGCAGAARPPPAVIFR